MPSSQEIHVSFTVPNFVVTSDNERKPWEDSLHYNKDITTDPARLAPHGSMFTDSEIFGHRRNSIHIPEKGFHCRNKHDLQNPHRHHRHRRLKRNHRQHPKVKDNVHHASSSSGLPFVLGDDETSGLNIHPVFSELSELSYNGGEKRWNETARWIKFEEDVEEGGNRWSKPHVGTLSLHSLFELRSVLLRGTICLDMDAQNLDDVIDLVLDQMISGERISYEEKAILKAALLSKHHHLHNGSSSKSLSHNVMDGNSNVTPKSGLFPLIGRSLVDIGRLGTSKSAMSAFASPGDDNNGNNGSWVPHKHKFNLHFMKKIPKGAETCNILVGVINNLERYVCAFVRLNNPVEFANLTQVPVPTRFIFIMLGPELNDDINYHRFHEIGRALGTLMSDEVFNMVAYKARKREQLLAGMDEFLDAVTILPPGEWDPTIRIEPPQDLPPQDFRRMRKPVKSLMEEEAQVVKERLESGLTRSGKLFGGLINDIKRKAPFYFSDFRDSLSIQCVASVIFIYFATLTPIVTFGGLLADATENRLAPLESLLAALIVGVSYGFFSGQPLTILGLTGPVLVFEEILYNTCKSFGWDYLSFRLCIGLWVGVFLLLLVATDASAFVCYITRFTEENFALLIAIIFIKKSFEKVLHISEEYPIHNPCMGLNQTELINSGEAFECLNYESNVFLMSVLLFIGTFFISFILKDAKSSNFFPHKVRSLISDFAVIIAIVSMVLIDFMLEIKTPKLNVPASLRPTWEGRGWLIHPLGRNQWWTALIAFFPALLATILIFMDQQITAVIVNRKEHKLLKGGGYHLDLFVVLIMIVVCSIFGLPWLVAATILSINHVRSLTRDSESAAPGEKPKFLGIREQRVTCILVFMLVGLSVGMTPMLRLIPMPVLYGVFLYMGVASLKNVQFFDRFLLFFIPSKHQPDYSYLRKVPLKRVHLFTGIQFICFIVLFIIKDIKQTSILFPLMLVAMIAVRKLLDFVFTVCELKVLDDILPHFSRSKILEEEEAESKDDRKGEENLALNDIPEDETVQVKLSSGNVMTINFGKGFNMTDELSKSSIWQVVDDSVVALHEDIKNKAKKKKLAAEDGESTVIIQSATDDDDEDDDDDDVDDNDNDDDEDNGIVINYTKEHTRMNV